MGFKTKIVVDESMEVWTEESLDDKFKPEAVWTTTFLQDEKNTEILATDGELDSGILKIKTKRKTREGFPFKNLPVLLYVKAEYIKRFMDDEKKTLSMISEFRYRALSKNFAAKDIDGFYECEKCGGYIEGHIIEEDYDDIKSLSGSAGVHYKCERCGGMLDSYAHTHS